MARVPLTTGQTVAPAAANSGFINVRSSPEQFGAESGRTAQEGGRQLLRASDKLADVAAELRQEGEQTYLLEKEQSFDAERQRLLNDPEGGALRKQGGATRGSTQFSEAEMDGFISGQMEGVPDHLKPKLEAYATKWKRSNMGTISTHERNQMRAYNTDLHVSRLGRAAEEGALVYSDTAGGRAAVTELKDRIRTSAAALAQLKGWSDDDGLQKDLVDRNISAMHSGIVNRFIANNQGMGAKKYLDENKAEIGGTDLAKLEANVQKAAITEEAITTAADITAKYGDDWDAQYKTAAKIKDADLRLAVEQRIGQLQARQSRLDAERDENTLENANQKVGTSTPLNANEEGTLKRLGKYRAWEMEHRAALSGDPGVTDNSVATSWHSMTSLEKANVTQEELEYDWLPFFATANSHTTVDDVQNQWEAAQVSRGKQNVATLTNAQKNRNAFVKATSINTYNDVLTDQFQLLGLSKDDNEQAVLRQRILHEIAQEVNHRAAQGAGIAQLTDLEVIEVVKKVASSVTWGSTLFGSTKAIYTVTDEQMKDIGLGTVPRERLDELAQVSERMLADEGKAGKTTDFGKVVVPKVEGKDLVRLNNTVRKLSTDMWADETKRGAVEAAYIASNPAKASRYNAATTDGKRSILQPYFENATLLRLLNDPNARAQLRDKQAEWAKSGKFDPDG